MSDCLADYDFLLPPELIAQHPPSQRDGGYLLDVSDNRCIHSFKQLPTLLMKNDLLVFNNSRVLPARLIGKKASGGRVEILLEKFINDHECIAQVRVSKPLHQSMRIQTDDGDFIVVGRPDNLYQLLAVNARNQPTSVKRRFSRIGQTPLPPYIRRSPDDHDKTRYQTVFARRPGSVAAPTAGLHFTDALLGELSAGGINSTYLTLHVGSGTFTPIRDNLDKHIMHPEYYTIYARTAAAIAATKKRGGRIVAVGTTVLRALESAAATNGGSIAAKTASTRLFIKPGFSFQVADLLLTNFHLPRSSLLLLACAFGGRQRVLAAYQQAIAKRLHFYSYGDAMLLKR